MAVTGRGAESNEMEPWVMAWCKIVVRSWIDPGFKDEVLGAGAARLRELCFEMGYELPADIELTVRLVAEPVYVLPTRVGASRIELLLPPPPVSEHQMIAIADYVRAGGMSPPFCCC
ncbi:nitrile hydratase subunit alpha [Hyalangium versicolor]|uniref:nitrile hydratase subunit alpha n=1 Tax=Hyalangium versicolor TaxID=2861190 RepID=UPI001CCF6A4F|nr:nitrile hydratase subunit alpha [Hyalangium versicolor]